MKNIFQHLKLRNNLISHQQHLEDGLITTQFDACVHRMVKENVFTILKMSKHTWESICKKNVLGKQFVMQEFHQIIKKMTWNDRFKYLKKHIHHQKLYPISVPELVSKDKDLHPFYNKYTMEISKQLWLPTKTDCVDLDLNSSNGCLNKQIQNSWFSIQLQKPMMNHTCPENLQMTCLQSPITLLQKTMDYDLQEINENVKNLKPQAERSIKMKVYPSLDQKETLKQWFGASRYIYNKILHYFKTTSKPCFTKKFLRSQFINNDAYRSHDSWMLDVPYDVRDEALSDVLHNYKTNFAKYKKSQKSFNISYRCKKKYNSMNILSKHWSHKTGLYAKTYNNWKYEGKQDVPDIKYTSRLILTPLKEYYLCIPKPIQLRCESQRSQKSVIALDPGVRTFLTGYDINNKTIEIGKNDIARLSRLTHHKRKLQKYNKPNIKKASLRLSKKIKNLVTDLHRKVIKWLCMNYKHVYIPKLNFHTFPRMRKKQRSKMSLLNHASFIDKLVEKQKEFPWCNIQVVGEAFTSKTCTNCGYIKYNLHSNKLFSCDECNIQIDRDINGARNILLKSLSSVRNVVA